MSKLHVYIDGTWLYNQCGRERTLTQYVESDYFFVDFAKLNAKLVKYIQEQSGVIVQPGGGLWYYTSIIRNIPDNDFDGNSLERLKKSSYAKEQTVKTAQSAGYDVSGVFEVPFQHWMPKQIGAGLFQEKMVDTSLVARMVLSSVQNPDDFHILVSGDLDMMPAISLVVPKYLERVILFTTNPNQWDPNMQQTSKRLTDYDFSYGPLYFDDVIKDIVLGKYVYTCDHPTCSVVLTRQKPIPTGDRPYCRVHFAARPARTR